MSVSVQLEGNPNSVPLLGTCVHLVSSIIVEGCCIHDQKGAEWCSGGGGRGGKGTGDKSYLANLCGHRGLSSLSRSK